MRLEHILASLFFAATPAFAAGTGHTHGPDIGHKGDPSEVNRVVEVEMDEMSFSPADMAFQPGETVRFVVSNTGQLVHEFNIGTDAMHASHLDEMQQMMENGVMSARSIDEERMHEIGMDHDDPSSLLLEPGETGEIIWTFPADTDLELACNVPGHRAGGMQGEIQIDPSV